VWLVVSDIGYLPFGRDEMDMLFSVVAKRVSPFVKSAAFVSPRAPSLSRAACTRNKFKWPILESPTLIHQP
jgi:hypothetical protein